MTPSELLELTSQLEFSKRCRWEANRSYCSPVIREEDVDHIIKSLRFAADMDRLISEGRCPSFYGRPHDNLANMGINAIQLSVYDGGERVHFYGRDAAAALRQCSERLYGENR